jgi:hypothetical protein
MASRRRRASSAPSAAPFSKLPFATELVGEVREADDVVASGGGEGVEGGGFHLDGDVNGRSNAGARGKGLKELP